MSDIKEVNWENGKSALRIIKNDPNVNNWLLSVHANSEGGMSLRTRKNYISVLKRFCVFLSAAHKKDKQLTLKQLVEEGQNHVQPTQLKAIINDFFTWLQGEHVEGYKSTNKSITYNSARIYAYGIIRGFFTHNGVVFGKFNTPKKNSSKVSTTDLEVALLAFDSETNKIRINCELLRLFYNKLNFRNRVILSALLSGGGNDIGDLLELTVGYIRSQMERENIFWQGNRRKTGFPFRVFFSKEATRLLKEYVLAKRNQAEDIDPLFVNEIKNITYKRKKRFGLSNKSLTEEITVREKLQSSSITQAFKRTALELGYNNPKTQNPFRPKRFRHLFNTLARAAGVNEGVLAVFQGHSVSVSQNYMELEMNFLYIEYKKVEPFLEIDSILKKDTFKELEEVKRENLLLKERMDKLECSNRKLMEHIITSIKLLEQIRNQKE